MPRHRTDQRPSAPAWAKDLNDAERRFVEEYLTDLNATKAYIRAGLAGENRNADSTRAAASDLKLRPQVARAIDKAMAEDASGPRQWIVGRLRDYADANIGEFVEPVIEASKLVGFKLRAGAELTAERMRVIKKIRSKNGEVFLELHDPLRALEILGKVGMIGLTKDTTSLDVGETLESLIMKAMAMKEAK